MIRLEIGLKIRHGGEMTEVCTTEDKTIVVVVVASYRSVSRNAVRVKALVSSVCHNPTLKCNDRLIKGLFNSQCPDADENIIILKLSLSE